MGFFRSLVKVQDESITYPLMVADFPAAHIVAAPNTVTNTNKTAILICFIVSPLLLITLDGLLSQQAPNCADDFTLYRRYSLLSAGTSRRDGGPGWLPEMKNTRRRP